MIVKVKVCSVLLCFVIIVELNFGKVNVGEGDGTVQHYQRKGEDTRSGVSKHKATLGVL